MTEIISCTDIVIPTKMDPNSSFLLIIFTLKDLILIEQLLKCHFTAWDNEKNK